VFWAAPCQYDACSCDDQVDCDCSKFHGSDHADDDDDGEEEEDDDDDAKSELLDTSKRYGTKGGMLSLPRA